MPSLTCVASLPLRRSRANVHGRGSLAVAACAVVLASGLCTAVALAGDVKPLFKVAIDHEFPNGRETVDEVVELILRDYYTDKVNEESLWWGAVEGILRRLSPEENKKLATIWPPDEYSAVDQTLRGVQESIGIKSTFNPSDGALTVTEVLAGGPSESLLFPLDRIVRIDGLPLKGLPLKQIDGLLKGDPGTRVSLKVIRDIMIFDLLVPRGRAKVNNVEALLLPDGVGYLCVKTFSQGVSERLDEELAAFAAKEASGVILDFRGNSGGVFGEALKSAQLFIAKGRGLMRMVTHGSKINTYVSDRETPFTFRTVVLVDGKSASASEIVAAALRDEVGALLVGTRSYGKATMEKTYTLENKFRVRFTNAALYSPKGKSWQKTGLLPDFVISQTEDIAKQARKLPVDQRLARDQQLRAAQRLLVDAAAEPGTTTD